ncbi:uncharacterized protein LOC128240513 [Mya arenaria]|uniref:uncharacterized protein LOC128240513 n=1 Tax=Mya arenaria TaxID=6604 RepID=UPI0022E2F52E|nr:uncharacterized protein LOC128240513 [Mya arenaria]
MGESSFDTQADIRSASGSLSRFGYQPTAEQMLSGQANLDHPTRNLDTTDLEAVGSSPADAASSMPSILSSILGAGAQPSVTDAQLDPAEQKSREQLIRQLGEAMGVIGDNPLSPGASTGKPKGAPNKAQQQQQSVAIAFGESSMTGTMDFLKPQNQQGQFTDGSLMSNTPGQQQEQTIGGLDQSMFGQDLNMFGYDMNTAQTEPDIPSKQQMTKPQPTKPESPKSPQASELEKLLQGTGLDMTSLQAVGFSIEDLIGAPSQSQPTTSTTTKPTMKPATTPAPIETPVDIGMAGMTLEHMMTILNMEQQSKGLGASTEPTGTLSDPLYPAQLGKAAPPNPTQQVVEVRPDSAQVGDFSSQSIEPNLIGLPEQTKTYDSQNQPLQNAQNLNFKQGMFDVIETKTKVIDGPSRTDASLKSDRTNTQGHNPDKVTIKTLQYPPISGTQYPPLPETHYSPVDKSNPFETILLEATNTGPVIERKGNSGSGSSSSSMSQASSQSSMNFMGMFGGLSDGSNQGKGTNPGPEAFAQSGPSSLTAEQLDAYMTGSLGMTNTGQLPSLTGNAQIETMLETSSSTKATEPSYTAPSGIMADVATNGTASLEFTQKELAAMENDPLLGLFGGDLGALQNFINHGVIDQMGDQGMGVGASKLQGSSQVTVESNTQTGAGSFLQNTSEQMDSQGIQGTLGDAAMDQYLQPSMSGAQDSTAASQQSASSATQAAQNEMMALEQFMAANAGGNANNAFAPMQGQGYQGNQNIDMAAMQQFLTAQGMMGANPQPEPPQTDYGTFMGNFQ